MALILRGKVYLEIKNYDSAITDFNTYIENGGTDSFAYTLRGDAYGAKGIYHKAIADYKTAIEKGYDPDEFEVGKPKKTVMSFGMAMYNEYIYKNCKIKNGKLFISIPKIIKMVYILL